MSSHRLAAVVFFALFGLGIAYKANPTSTTPAELVNLPYRSVAGVRDRFSIDRYLGIPYTDTHTPRFEEGVLATSAKAQHDGTHYGPFCPQIGGEIPEDGSINETTCLNLQIARHKSTTSTSKVPVVVFIYGGSFTDGTNAPSDWKPMQLTRYAYDLGKPIIYVSMNYRLNGFGFTSSATHKNNGVLNLGLRDQRLALKWVQKYIQYFGGDPAKVTLWGQSAGSIAVGHHLAAYEWTKETDLFRSVIMESGGPTSEWVPYWTSATDLYDNMLKSAGCDTKTTDATKFSCLKTVSQKTFMTAVSDATEAWKQKSTKVNPWTPVNGDDLITGKPSQLFSDGKHGRLPVLIGEVTDEGTTEPECDDDGVDEYATDDLVRQQIYKWTGLNDTAIAKLMTYYPNTLSAGSPYNTGNKKYCWSNQFKRVASFHGDLEMVSARRYVAQLLASHGSTVYTYLYNITDLGLLQQINDPTYTGVAHASDLPWIYFKDYEYDPQDVDQVAIAAYWVSFIYYNDPNVAKSAGAPRWDAYNSTSLAQMRFNRSPQLLVDENDDSATTGAKMAKDNYRTDGISYIQALYPALLR